MQINEYDTSHDVNNIRMSKINPNTIAFIVNYVYHELCFRRQSSRTEDLYATVALALC